MPKSLSASTSCLLRGCRHPRTASFRADRENVQENAGSGRVSLTDVDDFLQENFKSMYLNEEGETLDMEELPDISGSRITVPPPASSSSLIEEAAGAGHQEHDGERGDKLKPNDFITVLKDSDNLYEDFRNSMQEMIDARAERKGKINWEFMEELLLCYLNLNEQNAHRYILGAFVDLIGHLRDGHGGSNVPPQPDNPPRPNSMPSSSKGKEKV